jgi:transposase InsO family protein
MSEATSPSVNKPYGLERVCLVWELPRSTFYFTKARIACPPPPPKKRGPKGFMSDEVLLEEVRSEIRNSPFSGEGHRKIWARLRFRGVRSSRHRVRRIMRENNLLAPNRSVFHKPKVHDGTIIAPAPNMMWGTDMTLTVTTGEGNACVFAVVDHCTWELLGIHASKKGNRFEALEPIRQAVKVRFGSYSKDVALGLTARHDNGTQYLSDHFQTELKYLGIKSSPSFVREPEGNGMIERFFRVLKEQLLWVKHFATIEELRLALLDFKERYNNGWIMERHDYKTPRQAFESFPVGLAQAA